MTANVMASSENPSSDMGGKVLSRSPEGPRLGGASVVRGIFVGLMLSDGGLLHYGGYIFAILSREVDQAV
ncbi:hypothetical protein [Corynebacterium urealyticum]|uniref:hypothetical protein n=1 Tax=Corynebacterium urealyticum TaxID=43771 RepID=UPI00293EE1EE|nr:hypothetical protein [Corynebacterium urealyticum]WOH94204.1 hypothetical protein RZ943_09210 [Corynebacterium urealyticum]